MGVKGSSGQCAVCVGHKGATTIQELVRRHQGLEVAEGPETEAWEDFNGRCVVVQTAAGSMLWGALL